MRSLAALGVAAVAYQAAAQSASFDGMTWGIVLVGQVWPIHWTVGDGTPVSLFLGNTTWNEAIARMSTLGGFSCVERLTRAQQTFQLLRVNITGLSVCPMVSSPATMLWL